MIDRRRLLLGAGAALAAAGCGASRGRGVSPRPRRVVVVGAGLSGLVVAHELVKRGREVMVLEAADRPGGRIRTVRGFPDGMYVEAGAMHVLPDPALVALIRELGVATASPKRTPLASVRYRNGERRVFAVGEAGPPEHELSPEEAALDPRALMRRYFAVVERIDPLSMTWTDELVKLDQQSCGDYLRAQGASRGYIAELDASMAIGEGIDTISALDVARVLASIERERALPPSAGMGSRIAGGSDSLPRALAAKLGDRIAYGTALVQIERRGDGTTLVVADRTGTHRIEAARVVLTMPFTVLRRIDVAPRWSPLKARAIAELDMTAVTRIWVASDRRYWEERGESGRAESDLPTGPIRDYTEAQPGRAGVLGVYAAGPRAHRLAALAPAARIAALTADVERVHPAVAGHIVHGDSVAWESEPFARGAYAAFRPGQLTALAAAAAAPEGVIHFAGCGTSYRPGFMHGALASATRVLAELDEAAVFASA